MKERPAVELCLSLFLTCEDTLIQEQENSRTGSRRTTERHLTAMDNTDFFRQCVDIYTESIRDHEDVSTKRKILSSESHIANSEFYTKATSIHHALLSLMTLINTIRPQYLLANSKELSEDQKIIIDTEIKLKIQRLSNKVKNLQDAQTRLDSMNVDSEELTNCLSKIGFSISSNNNINNNHTQSWKAIQSLTRNLISMGDYSDYVSVRNETLRTIFSNIVKSLTLLLQKIVFTWNDMHDKRVERLIQLRKSALSTSSSYKSSSFQPQSFQMNEDMFKLNDSNSISSNTIKNIRDSETRYITDDYEILHDQLPQQELQQLQVEQDSLAEELKRGTIDTVTQIEESMMDVASMVREIGMQLSMQNENITLLDQHKDEIVGNVKSGNTVLVKANEANSKKNKTLAWSIFFAAIILLMIDYIL
ncbi:hypothetical protein C6P40_004881 [Pichia californica]|uniref:t-SNARE coiled-coil homology domain-containing protein n=1 Tax=Pichia californica TaxID=460514 RepID=A0A9P6WPP3_9ASCO|nr:hypothetical protein C6P40_004881 [[Candida] californica]